MTSSHTPTLPHRSWLVFLFVGLLLGLPATTAPAQSVASIVDQMRARYEQQMQSVDTYIVETNLYTSYNKKVMQDGEPTYQTQTKMTGEDAPSVASTSTPSAAYGLQFDRLKEHATYAGTETVNGVRAHVLQVDDPSKVNPDMARGDAESMTYYVDAEQYLPTRMVMTTKGGENAGPQGQSVTINMKDYQTTDGLTLPHRMEIEVQINMSEQQRRQMEQAMAQMENMPAQQRKQMERMMGDRMEMMKQMMAGDPVVVEVQRVQVNVDLPEGMF
jgi:outer membrane lipoprotein-sorting protein